MATPPKLVQPEAVKEDLIPQEIFSSVSSSILPSKLPYPLSEFENKPRSKYLDGEIGHYVFFWTCAGAIAGLGLGCASFYRRHRYRMWVRKQPQAVQLKILEKNNILQSGSLAESQGIATSRFSTLPHAMDTRMTLPYTNEYRPYKWYELGPLKLWNNFAYYPWASELFTEVGKWSIRVSLLCATTLAFESGFCMLFGYPLGVNPYIRFAAGTFSGYFIGKIASEGIFLWYQSLGAALALGTLWAFATVYNPNWGQIARDNQFVIEMYSKGIHKSVQKHYKAEELGKQLYAKEIQEKSEIYEEFLRVKFEEEAKNKGDETDVDTIDLLASLSMKEIENHWLVRFLLGKNREIEVSKEIDEMPYEQRKQLEKKALGDKLAVNYNTYPFKALDNAAPQFFVMDQDKLRNESDTAVLVNRAKVNNREKPTAFDQNKSKKANSLTMLS